MAAPKAARKKKGNENITNDVPVDMRKMDSNIYGTSPKDYPLWVDVLFERLRLPFPISAIFLGILAYLVGLLISITISFQREYAGTLPVYIGAFGVTWVTAVLNYSSRTFHESYEELRPCFLINDKEYAKIIDRWFKLFSNHKLNLRGIFALALLAIGAVYFSMYYPNIIASLNINSLTQVFPPYWYFLENKWVKALIISVWGIVIAFPLGTAARLLIFNFFFLLRLRNLPVIPIPSMIKTRLQKISNLYIFIASTWFVGVGLFGVLLFDKLDFISVLALAVLSLLGTVTFLTPQFIYRQFLVQSHKVASQWVLYSFYSSLNIKLYEKPTTKIPTEIGSSLSKMDDLKGFIDVSKQNDIWVYDPTDFLILLLGQVVSFGSVYIENFIKALLP
ncbi:MAG: hypothetical protein EHM20_13660 [Alphaproteobacteria bacterium]|nr:MAG: hypothetical protein EHM20_13660 [Alphaproteobacteria bacterium]